MIVGISGYKQSGKDTVGKIIQCYQAGYDLDDTLIALKEGDIISDSLWEIKGFAHKVKKMLSLLTDIPVADMEKEEVKSSYLPSEWDRYVLSWDKFLLYGTLSRWYGSEEEAKEGIKKYKKEINSFLVVGEPLKHNINFTITRTPITVRQALQWIGTDLFRDMFHPNTWVNALFADYKPSHLYLDVRVLTTSPDFNLRKGSTITLDRDWLARTERSTDDQWKIEKNLGDGKYRISQLIENAHLEPEDIFKSYRVENEYPNWIITDVRFPNEAKAIKERGGIVIRVNRFDYTKEELADMHESETALDDYHDFDCIINNKESLTNLIEQVTTIAQSHKLK